MAHATNRTEMLAKSLKRAREDFSLHNARTFARSVIDAPDGVFGEKPLTFLPRTGESPAMNAAFSSPVTFASTDSAAPDDTDPGRPKPGLRDLIAGAIGDWQFNAENSVRMTTDQVLDAAAWVMAQIENGPGVVPDSLMRPDELLSRARPGDVVVGHDGGVVGVVVDDGQVFANRTWTPLEHLARVGVTLRRVDVRSADPLAELDPDHARTSMLAQLLPLFGWTPDGPRGTFLAKVLHPEYRRVRNIDTLADLIANLRMMADPSARALIEKIEYWITEPNPFAQPKPQGQTAAAEPGSRAAVGGEWSKFVKALSKVDIPEKITPAMSLDLLKVVPPPKFPTLEAESADDIDVLGLITEMGGRPHVHDLLHRVVPRTKMSDAITAAIGSGAVTLNVDRTVEVAAAAPADPAPVFNLPSNAPRLVTVRRDAAEAARAWMDTSFNVGVSPEGPVTWTPARSGSLLVEARSGEGKTVFADGAATDARIGGWGVIQLGGFMDAATYAKGIADAHALSMRRSSGQAPVLVVLDDFESFSRKFAATGDTGRAAEVSGQILEMLESAITSRVHLILTTHDMHAQTIPFAWLPHFGVALMLGRPSAIGMKKLADGVAVPDSAFPQGVRGRGVFVDRWRPGTHHVVQTYRPTQAKDALEFVFGEDELTRMNPDLARELAERPSRPLTPHEIVVGRVGGAKLRDVVEEIAQNKTPVDSWMGSMMGALFGRPASDSTVDPSKPSHFAFDSLGDPLTCTGDHNHPDPEDEPRGNVAIRAEHELAALPEPVTRPGSFRADSPIPEAGLAIGVGPSGETVMYTPTEDGPLLVFGATGRGKSTLARGLLADAASARWAVMSLDSRKDPEGILDHLRNAHEAMDARRDPSVDRQPLLLVIDDALWADFDEGQRAELDDLVTGLLSHGREKGIHLVLVTLTLRGLLVPPRWRERCSSVLLAGKLGTADAVKLFGDAADMLPRSGWDGSGKMVLVRDPESTGGFLPEPLRAYTEPETITGD